MDKANAKHVEKGKGKLLNLPFRHFNDKMCGGKNT